MLECSGNKYDIDSTDIDDVLGENDSQTKYETVECPNLLMHQRLHMTCDKLRNCLMRMLLLSSDACNL